MRYPVLKAANARIHLASLDTDSPKDAEGFVGTRGDGDDMDISFVGTMRAELLRLRASFPSDISKGSSAGPAFESQAAEIVHKLMPNVSEVLTDPEFWVWLAVIHFKELISWRYGTGGRAAESKNYGIGASGENFLYRLWLRGELGLDETARDKYDLCRRGDIDFWRSHLFRQGYANGRLFARALIRFQYPDEAPGAPRLKIAQIRELVKRLRRVRSNLLVEMLDEALSTTLINAELAQMPASHAQAPE